MLRVVKALSLILGVAILVALLAPAPVRQSMVGLLGDRDGVQSTRSGLGGPVDTDGDFVAAVLGSTEDVWTDQFARKRLAVFEQMPGATYRFPRLVLYSLQTPSVCGSLSAAAGPLYCPSDKTIYLDPDFFGELSRDLNAPGDFARAYVIAHEVAHHVQNELGILKRSDAAAVRDPASVTTESMRVELQADCFAGVWGHHVAAQKAPSGGSRVEAGDFEEALGAAHAVGDDTLGYSHAESFTHGAADQRKRWFARGFDTGDVAQCDTFNAAQL